MLDDIKNKKEVKKSILLAEEWCSKEKMAFNTNLVFPTCYIWTAVYPTETKKRFLCIKLTLWIFFLDDYFDDPAISVNQIQSFVSKFNLNSQHENRDIPQEVILISAFKTIKKSIITVGGQSGYELFWYYCDKMIVGMLNEKLLSCSDNNNFSVVKYLEQGKYTIGSPCVCACMMAFNLEGLNIKNILDTNLVIEVMGKILRIKNDVATYHKEIEEGKKNIIGLLVNNCCIDLKKSGIMANKLLKKYLKDFEDNIDTVYPKKMRHKYQQLLDVSIGLYKQKDVRYIEPNDV